MTNPPSRVWPALWWLQGTPWSYSVSQDLSLMYSFSSKKMEFTPPRNNTLHLRAMDSRLPSTRIRSPPHRQGHTDATVPSTIISMCGLTLVTDYSLWLKVRKPIQPRVLSCGWEWLGEGGQQGEEVESALSAETPPCSPPTTCPGAGRACRSLWVCVQRTKWSEETTSISSPFAKAPDDSIPTEPGHPHSE